MTKPWHYYIPQFIELIRYQLFGCVHVYQNIIAKLAI